MFSDILPRLEIIITHAELHSQSKSYNSQDTSTDSGTTTAAMAFAHDDSPSPRAASPSVDTFALSDPSPEPDLEYDVAEDVNKAKPAVYTAAQMCENRARREDAARRRVSSVGSDYDDVVVRSQRQSMASSYTESQL